MPGSALLVIDMLNDFIAKNGALYCGETSEEIIPYINKLIAERRENVSLVISVQDNHTVDDPEFRLFPSHCIQGQEGSRIYPGVNINAKDLVILKPTFSAFYKTTLNYTLENHGINEVHLCGVCTSICIMETCSDLFVRNMQICVHKKGVADFDQMAHEFALQRMEKIFGAKII